MSCARHLKLTHFRASIMIKSDPQWFPKQSGLSSLMTGSWPLALQWPPRLGTQTLSL